MKKAASVILITLLLMGCGALKNLFGKTTSDPLPTRMQNIYDLPGFDKDLIYDSALSWMKKSFATSEGVINLQDKDSGKIIGKGLTHFFSKDSTSRGKIPCRYNMIIETKDNKMRVTYDDLTAQWTDKYETPVEEEYQLEQLYNKFTDRDKKMCQYIKNKQTNLENW
jgi:hypothetical protein